MAKAENRRVRTHTTPFSGACRASRWRFGLVSSSLALWARRSFGLREPCPI
jgi:hypothetical protein